MYMGPGGNRNGIYRGPDRIENCLFIVISNYIIVIINYTIVFIYCKNCFRAIYLPGASSRPRKRRAAKVPVASVVQENRKLTMFS